MGDPILIEHHGTDDALCLCENCDWRGPFSALAEPEGAILTAGDPSPAGRCPECGTLAYLATSAASTGCPAALSESRKVRFEVRSTAGGPLHPDQHRLFVTTGRYNYALCDASGAILRTFVPASSRLDDVLAGLGRFYEVADLMNYHPDPDDLQPA